MSATTEVHTGYDFLVIHAEWSSRGEGLHYFGGYIMAGLIDPSKLVIGEPIHCTGASLLPYPRPSQVPGVDMTTPESAQIQAVHLADGQGDLRGTACGRQDGYDGWYDGIVVTNDKSAVTCPECLAGPNDGT